MPETDVDAASADGATAPAGAPVRVDLQRSPGRMPYRPALDGIRAIAVTAVLLYHGGVSWLPGGFLGVDVFFVLSGYLITELFLRERSVAGTISLPAFWARRARRLLPAMYAMVLFTGLYARFAAAGDEVARIREDGIATLLYVANWWYAFADQSYFERYAVPSPLRHTWSLSIEEQFYLVFPLVMVAGLAAWGVKRRRWVGALTAAAVCSAVLMAVVYDADADPSRVFYSTFTRAQALLLGAALAWVLHRVALDKARTARLEIGGWIGLAGVVGFFGVAHDGNQSPWMYRGGFFLVALAAAALVAAASSEHAGPLAKTLAVAPLVALGRISYGVYLWHWPIFVWLWPTRVDLDPTALLAVRLVVTLVVAVVSYQLIEQPVRRHAMPARQLAGGLVAGGVVTLLVFVVLASGGTETASGGGTTSSTTPVVTLAPGQQVKVFVAGDSMAFSLAVGGFVAAGESGAVIDSGAVLGCGVLPGQAYGIDGVPLQAPEECGDWTATWQDRLSRFDADVSLLLTGAWDVWDRMVDGTRYTVGSPAWQTLEQQSLQHAIDTLATGGAPVVIALLPCAADPEALGPPPVPERPEMDRIDWLNEMYRRAATANPGRVSLVDLGELQCPDGATQVTEIDGTTITKDGVHYEVDGTRVVWDWLTPRLAQQTTP